MVVGGCDLQFALFAFVSVSICSRRHFAVFSLFSRSVFARSSID